jgi:2-methylcitrate dehydratase PrpD
VRVEVRLKDGRRLERSADTPRGSDANFAAATDIIEKFEKLAVLRLEQLADAAELAAVMAKR